MAVSDVRVRPLTPHDKADVARIDAAHTGESKQAYWTRIFQDFIGSAAPKGRVGLAAERGGVLVGFLFGDVRAFEFGSEPCGWILEIGVEPDASRKGVATALLRAGVEALRQAGVQTVRTMVRRNDIPVLTFFRTNGFAGGPYVQLELTPDAEV